MAPDAPTGAGTTKPGGLRSLELAALRPTIDRVVRLARKATGAAHAYVTLATDEGIWRSPVAGEPAAIEPASSATTRPCLSNDAAPWRDDLRVVQPEHPWVIGPAGFRFHANSPIVINGGARIGALCVAGDQPRAQDEEALAALDDLADVLAAAIVHRQPTRADDGARDEALFARALKETVLNGAPIALSMLDRDLRYIYVNDRWLQDRGLTREQTIGQPFETLFPDTWVARQAGLRRCLAGETIRGDRVHLPSPGHPDRWLSAEMVAWRDAAGDVAGVIIQTHDISSVVASLDRAVRSEQRLKLALEIADVMVYELDYRARTLKVDGAADTFFGGALPYEDLARDIWMTVHPEDRPAAIAAWERHASEGTPFRTEYRLNTPDGREVWVFSASELIKDEDGRITGLLGVLSNITARKRSEAATERARLAAEAANRAKSEFLANMSHEIRTPLNGVMGVAAALARTELTSGQSEMVDLIVTSGQTLEAILADVLDLARIESGRLELKPEAFDLEASLRSASSLFEAGAAAKGLTLALDVAPEAAGAFVGDAVRVRQIISNLLSNAVKFTSAGGLTVRARATEEGELTRLSLTVSDTGIGFSADAKARLFERFEQADGSITRRFGGTGLGLSISRALAEAMGGQLDAESTPGQGAAFTLSLPLRRAPRQAAGQQVRARTPEPIGDGRAPRVLLAEDHPVNRKVVALLLAPVGVELITVEDGAQAVEAAANGDFDLILMDMQMPVMDGLAATRLIRVAERAAGRRPTPIWALTANALPEHVAASRAAGADGHLSKPISAEGLFEVLAEACARAEAASVPSRA